MKATAISVIVSLVIIGVAFVFGRGGVGFSKDSVTDFGVGSAVQQNNVSVVDGVQIVEIRAKGGYSPIKSVAKAGIPTILRFDTVTTFDCSAAVRIPSMDISKILPQSGTTDIDIGVQEAKVLRGSCGMGMYPFEVEFQG